MISPTTPNPTLPSTATLDRRAPRHQTASPPGFGQQLHAASHRPTPPAADHTAPGRPSLHELADQLVSTAFVLPLLEQARQDPFKSELFHGGRGEEVFGQQLDVIMAERITASSNFGLADAIARQFGVADTDTAPAHPATLDTHG